MRSNLEIVSFRRWVSTAFLLAEVLYFAGCGHNPSTAAGVDRQAPLAESAPAVAEAVAKDLDELQSAADPPPLTIGWPTIASIVLGCLLIGYCLQRAAFSAPGTASPTAASPPRGSHYLLLAAGFTALAIYGSLVPLEYTRLSWVEALERFRQIPFLKLGIESRADWVANILLFIPIGFFWQAAATVDRGRLAKLFWAAVVPIACCGLSVALEFSQLWFPPRTVSQNDILAETIGGCVGVALWLAVGTTVTEWLRSWSAERQQTERFNRALQVYCVGLIVYSLIPFDLTISIVELHQKYVEGKIELVPFGNLGDSAARIFHRILTGIVAFIPVGIAASRLWLRTGQTLRPVSSSFAVGLLIVLSIEAAQLIVYSRYTSITDLILGSLGVLAGILGVRAGQRATPIESRKTTADDPMKAAAPFIIAAGLYSLFLIYLFWSPFEFTRDSALIKSRLNAFFAVPFASLYAGTELHAFVQIVRKVVWFFPLGAVAAMAVLRVPGTSLQRRMLQIATAALLILGAGIIEVGQVLQPSRIADLTDVFLYAAGALAGFFVTARLTTPQTLPGRPERSEPDAGKQAADAWRQTSCLGTGWIPGLDGLRAAACLAVFGVHWQQMTGVGPQIGPFDGARFLKNGNTGVALFFLLTGFLLSLPLWKTSPSSRAKALLDGFVRRRLARIVPAYFVCLSVLVLAKQHWQSDPLDVLLHGLFLHNLTESSFYSISTPFWAIAVIVQFYVAFAILVCLLDRLRWTGDRALLSVFAVLCVASYAVHVCLCVVADAGDGAVITHSLIAHLPVFLLGSLAGYAFTNRSELLRRLPASKAWVWDALLWICAGVILVILGTRLDDYASIPYGRYNLPFVPVLLVAMMLAAPHAPLTRRLLECAPVRLLGVISFGIYIYHLPCLRLMARVMNRLGLPPFEMPVLFAVAGLAVSIVVAAVSYRLIEKPLLNWAHRLPSGKPAGRHPLPEPQPSTCSAHPTVICLPDLSEGKAL